MPEPSSKPTDLGESVVDDVRAIREAIDEEVDHDPRLLAERARKAAESVRREYGMKTAELPSSDSLAT